MARVDILDEKTIQITVGLEDAVSMVREASLGIAEYASEIVTLYEKMLGVDPKDYNSFTLDAADSFFYSLYGGMAALYEEAKGREIQ